jgi:hypothetical protein
MWIKDNIIYETHSDIRRANPNVSMPKQLSDELISEFGYELIQQKEKPVGDVVTEGTPVFNEETQQWEQAWDVRDFTEEEIAQNLADRRVAMIVSPRQARLALLNAGLLSNIETAITSLEEPTKSAVQIEWEYAVSIERNSSWVIAMTESLGMTPEDVDDLFEIAKEL